MSENKENKQNKRSTENDEDNQSVTKKRKEEICTYQEKCYRKNPHHFMEYKHPHLEILLDLDEDDLNANIPDSCQEKSVILEQIKILRQIKMPSAWKNFSQSLSSSSSSSAENQKPTPSSSKTTPKNINNNFAEKLKQNSPYNLFFTVIPNAPDTKNQPNSITITDLLCPSLGELKCSLQINFIIDIMWLMERYAETGNEKKPITIIFGEDFEKMRQYMDNFLPNVTYHLMKLKDPFGIHHSKVGMYVYEDGSIRIVISTANLYYEDWNNYCQGLWVSPTIPPLADDKPNSEGNGPTGFKKSLLEYLQHYNLPILKEWIGRVERADFSEVKVFFIASLPGSHPANSQNSHLKKVGHLLSQHCSLPTTEGQTPLSWQINAQSSSLGSFGATPASWLRTVLLKSLASHKNCQFPTNSNAKFNIVFPTVKNVMSSYFGAEGGGCLPYTKKVHDKQKWLETYLREWKAERTCRTRAMPHIKTYCRVSQENDKLAYFLLTSANISKAAWGVLNKSGSVYVRSYEVGVLFLPKFFDQEYFHIENSTNLFPFMYDLPLIPYKSEEVPYTQ